MAGHFCRFLRPFVRSEGFTLRWDCMIVRIDEDGCLCRLTIWTYHNHWLRLQLLLSCGDRNSSNHHYGLLLNVGVHWLLLSLGLCSCGHHDRLLLDEVGVGDCTAAYRLCLHHVALRDHADLLWI